MEELMQYVWQHRLWPPGTMKTVDGREITVIDQGRLNNGSGPDFFNAKIRIGGKVWAGDVEIHVRASDWHRHRHDGDPAYDTVILHVVGRDDTPVMRGNGETIPQLLLPCSPSLRERYIALAGRSDADMPCAGEISITPPLYISDWMTALLMERLYAKTARIESILARSSGDWQTACFATVARGLGFGTNAEPMERLALAVPLPVLNKHSDSQLALEAILFGRAGLLDEADAGSAPDSYPGRLAREYRFLAAKFGFAPCQPMGWKSGRLRPGNMPHRRIAMLASLCRGGFGMLSRILEIESEDDARALFDIGLDGYWATHYSLRPTHPRAENTDAASARLSRASVTSLIINVVAPLIMAHGLACGDDFAPSRAVALLESLPPESNSVVTLMERAGLKMRDAADTQAAIQLRRSYCETRKCLYCRLGHRMMSRWAAGMA